MGHYSDYIEMDLKERSEKEKNSAIKYIQELVSKEELESLSISELNTLIFIIKDIKQLQDAITTLKKLVNLKS